MSNIFLLFLIFSSFDGSSMGEIHLYKLHVDTARLGDNVLLRPVGWRRAYKWVTETRSAYCVLDSHSSYWNKVKLKRIFMCCERSVDLSMFFSPFVCFGGLADVAK